MDSRTYDTWRWTPQTGQVNLGGGTYRKLHTGGGMPAISADGTVVASSMLDGTGTRATQGRWTVAGGWQQLTPPLPADGGVMDGNDSNVWGMSRDGTTITGLYWRPGQPGGAAHGSVWTAATNMVGLPTDGGSSRVDDANGDGSVLAGWEESPTYGVRRATVWVNGVKTVLEADDGAPSEATKLNTAGTIVVGSSYEWSTNRTLATRWDWSGSAWVKTVLGVIPKGGTRKSASYASAVSDDGSVIVGMQRDNAMQFTSRGFIWTAATGMLDFDAFTRAEGTNLRRQFTVASVPAVTPDGKVFIVSGYPVKNPGYLKSLRVEKVESTATPR
jgi:hypothetical protein